MPDLEAQRRRPSFGKRASAPAWRAPSQRLRVLAVSAALVLIGLLWMAEVHSQLWHSVNCENLSHRNERFVTRETTYMCLSDGELRTVIRDLVVTAAAIFEANHVTYFLESGTLLGSYRERGVIHHDKDADLGIDAAGLKFLQRNRVDVPDGYDLSVWNSALYPDSRCDGNLPVRLTHKATALYADVFAFLNWKNATTGEDAVGPKPSVCFWSCKACPKVGNGRHFKVPREWVYPLVDCPFEGRTFKCPRESAKYLEHMYGRDFMTPNGGLFGFLS